LDGEWEFFPKQFVPPGSIQESFSSKEFGTQRVYLKVPGVWNQVQPGLSYATYRIRIFSPEEKLMGIRIPDINTACRVFFNGKLIASAGNVSEDPNFHKPQLLLFLEPLEVQAGENELLIHVSNFSHYKGGMLESVKIGEWQSIRKEYLIGLASELFLSGAILIMGIYHLGLFLLRRKDKTPLYFSLFCLLITVRVQTVGERFLLIMIPDIPWEVGMNLEYNAYYFPPILFLMFIDSMYPGYLHKYLLRFFMIISIIFSIHILILPATIYPFTNMFFHFFIFMMIVSSITTLVRAMIDKREGSYLFLLGLFPLIAATINDILFSMLIIQTYQMISVGLFVFIFIQSVLLSMKFSKALENAENYSQKLSSLDKIKDEFLIHTSSELSSPLYGIVEIARSMIEDRNSNLNKDQIRNLEMIVSGGSKLYSLVNDILDFSKIKNKDLNLNFKPIDISSVIDIILTTLKPFYKSKGLKILKNIPETIPFALGDVNRIQQIFYNIIGNAIKFTQEGEIQISVSALEDHLKISVVDTGIGIDASRLPFLFSAFDELFTLNGSTVKNTGMGLAITKKLIELHGGSIHVESSPGKGSRFNVYLPIANDSTLLLSDTVGRVDKPIELEPAEERNLTEVSSEGLLRKTHKEKDTFSVLIVDDEPIHRQVIKNQLQSFQYIILEAGSGAEALKILTSERVPDLAIVDVFMPIMNGYEVCAKIRENYNMQQLPILLLITGGRIQDIVSSLESGANDYLLKPFDKSELITRVKNLISLKSALEEQTKYLQFQNELKIAKSLQESILPEKPPKIPGLQISYEYTPMEQIGGDFFDFFELGEDRFGVIIADVSGHGIPAALIASMFKIAASIQFDKTDNPAHLLASINQTLYGKTKNEFVTASYIEFHIRERKLYHARAGHPPMLFLSKNSDEIYQSIPAGILLGWIPDTSYSNEEIYLSDIKRIVLYTDGVIEARSPDGELFGTERLIQILIETKNMETNQALSFVKNTIYNWTKTKSLEDDLTMILIDLDFTDRD